ncbi:centrosomal protein of 126 kDa-like isoform X1 [Lytechinus pictus]|uniref:centrosomal protein of 126 kDa-like isoform X1 n=1 Tax=Lytechinus pictus TaxID=7653 RepID=UPI0030BA037A
MLTDTARGYYSNNKYQILEQEQLTRMKDVGSEHAKQIAARDRAKKLSVETNRRRKALETKKKLEAQREAKRRQEVLDERRQRQREATNRYQRQNKGSARRHHDFHHTAPAYPGAPLHDNVHIARGYRMESPQSHGSGTPSLDDVLQMVGVPTSLSLKYGQGYSTYQHNGTVPASTYPTTSNYSGAYVDSNANIASGSEARGYAKPTQSALQSVAKQGRTDSRTSLIEQEIAEQQQKLIEQQQRTLQEFSQAIQHEASKAGSESGLHRSESLSSVDSLEEHRREREDLTQNYGTKHQRAHATSSYENINGVHVSNGPGVGQNSEVKKDLSNYSLYHNNVLMRGSNDKQTQGGQETKQSTRTTLNIKNDSVYDGIQPKGVAFNGITQTATASAHNATNGTLNGTAVRSQNGKTEKTTTGNGTYQEKNGTAHAWSNSKASKPPIQQHVSAPTASTSQRSRPYSARTTATVVTVAPAVSYPARTQEAEQSNASARGTDAYGGMSSVMPYPPQDKRFEETPQQTIAREDITLEEEEEPEVVSPPKSILKRHKSETPTKDRKAKGLAAAIMKDSLDIGKQSGIKSPKKGVRWTDLTYSDDESVETQAAAENATPVRKPRIISSVDARTVQERLGGKTDSVVSGIPPRPKSGNANGSKGKSMQLKNNRFPTGTESKQNVVDNDRAAAGKAPVIQNGVRLDKTPTDDEINWLWDKVRTCLNTREDGTDQKNGHVPQTPNTRQSSSTNPHQDQRITANLRVAPPSNNPRFSQYNDTLRRQVIVPRYRTNSDSGTHVQQTPVSQQRRPHVRSSSASRTNGQRGPEPSQQGPGRSATVAQQYSTPGMTDSLMAFQQAEQMVQQNADEADVAEVIDQQRLHHQGHQDHKANPSALSIEEAKVLESLDRLNARLKTVTADMNGSFSPIYPVMPPRPPQHKSPNEVVDDENSAGFRGHRPMSSRPGANGVTRPSYRTRAQSADRSNGRMGHHR